MKTEHAPQEVEKWIYFAKKYDLDWQSRSLGELRYFYENDEYPSRLYSFFARMMYGIEEEVKAMVEVPPLLSSVVFIEILLLTFKIYNYEKRHATA